MEYIHLFISLLIVEELDFIIFVLIIKMHIHSIKKPMLLQVLISREPEYKEQIHQNRKKSFFFSFGLIFCLFLGHSNFQSLLFTPHSGILPVRPYAVLTTNSRSAACKVNSCRPYNLMGHKQIR